MTPSMKTSGSGAEHAAVRAILLMLVALFLFSALDASAKWLARDGLPVTEIAWLRFLGQTCYMLVIHATLRSPAPLASE